MGEKIDSSNVTIILDAYERGKFFINKIKKPGALHRALSNYFLMFTIT